MVKKKVTCTAYIKVNGELVDVDTLNSLQKNYLGAKIQETILNRTHMGKVEFKADLPPIESVFPKGERYDKL